MTSLADIWASRGFPGRALSRWYRGLPERGLAIRELTCLFGVVDPSDPALRDALARQDEQLDDEYEESSRSTARAVASYAVPGLHSFRFTLIAPSSRNDDKVQKAPSLLVMSVVFDGDERDVLTVLYQKMRPQLDEVLQHVHGFAGTSNVDQFMAFLLERRVRNGFFYRDIGAFGRDRLDATRTEVEEALALRADFVRFYAAHRTDPPEVIKAAFLAWCKEKKVGFPLPLSKFERAIDEEHRWIRRVVELTLRLQDRNARNESGHRKRRVAHTKHHGFMTATFQVEPNLDPKYAKGIFAEPKAYKAVVRTSNTQDTRRPDFKFDGRGISIKVLDAGRLEDAVIQPQPEKRPEPCNDALPVVESSPGKSSQDFLLVGWPTFFTRDIRDFTVFRSLLDVRVPQLWLGVLAFFIARPRRAWILARTIFQWPRHPFEREYHSMAPYALGEDQVVKYMVRAADPVRFARFRRQSGTENSLSVALQESLKDGPIQLDFYIHAPPPAEVEVEESLVDWDRDKYPPVRVATVTIDQQDPATPTCLEQGERTVFNPWNARKEHRPLGSLNRARHAIYRASAESRRKGDQPSPLSTEGAFRTAPENSPSSPITPPSDGVDAPSTVRPEHRTVN